MESFIAHKGEKTASKADREEDDPANEDEGALFRLMDGVDVVAILAVIFEAEPAELVTAGTRHVLTPSSFLDRDLALGALVGQEDEVQ